ncbi:MAG: four helix bundle protein [Patescibacteria group bacterium]|nr:four helix bundle protein [Patescibacteria group bacterium]
MVYRKIKSFNDLEIYRSSYKTCVIVFDKILPLIPSIERNDLSSQLRRSCKAIPRLIAEGYAKKHQKAGFQKYLDDALAEINETIVGLSQLKDFYNFDKNLCNNLIEEYDKIARQTFTLAKAWDNFNNKRITKTKT